MKDAIQKEIGGRVYTIGCFPAVPAIKIQTMLAKLIGGTLFRSVVAGGGAISAESIGADAIAGLFADLKEEEVLRLLSTVYSYIGVGAKARICQAGDPTGLDMEFTGRNKDLWLVFLEALKFNFSDFFPVSPSPSTQAGTATG